MKHHSIPKAKAGMIIVVSVLSIMIMSYSLMMTPTTLATSTATSLLVRSALNVSSTEKLSNVKIDILSPTQINGIAGQFVIVKAKITNLNTNETIRGIAYISIVDINNSQPIDLEDWSAEKGFSSPPCLVDKFRNTSASLSAHLSHMAG